ncbi:hypothetical protein GCM10010388_29130 [Streptomyces mauvecolor]
MHSTESRILVVDDDPTVAEVVTGYLERAGHTVDLAADGPAALRAATRRRPDLVVLDLMLPGMDGLEVCRRLRATAPIPVIMLTARGDEDDRILGLEIGADDYVTKPFSPRELVLRVESVLRRARTATARPGPRMSRSGIALDPAARTASKDGNELALTLREFDLLAYLLARPGEAISRERLMHEVWGWEFGDLSTVTVHVRRLRGKIETDPAKPVLIRTVWGVGYRFETESEGEGTAEGSAAAAHGAGVAAHGAEPYRGRPHGAELYGTEPHVAGRQQDGAEPYGAELHGLGLHGAQPHGREPHGAQPHGLGPHGAQPLGREPHGAQSHEPGPHSAQPYGAEPSGTGADAAVRRGGDHG